MKFLTLNRVKMILLIIVLIFIIYNLNLNFSNINYLELLFVFLITFISDNLKIFWRKDERLVSNTVGFVYAFLLGYEYILIVAFATLFRLSSNLSLEKRFYKYILYLGTYLISSLIANTVTNNSINNNIILSLFLFITLSKIINTILVDFFDKFELKVFFFEYMHFLTLIPYAYIYTLVSPEPIRYPIILVNFIFLIFYYFIIKHFNERKIEIQKNDLLNKQNQIILEVSKILKEFSLKESEEKILQEIANIIQGDLNFSYVLISLFDKTNDLVKRVSQAGISKEKYEEIKNKEVKIPSVMNFMEDKHKYLETYFIPEYKDQSQEITFKLYEEKNDFDIDTNEKLWNEDDLLLVSLRNQNNEIIGYISCDKPKNGMRPSKETLTILSVFAQLVSLIIQNSQLYNEVVGIAETDGLTNLYNHSKLFVDMELIDKIKTNYSLAFLDLDNFKIVNDSYGHLQGDIILKETAQLLKNKIRDTDNAYRYGGDEFVVIFKNINKNKCKQILERFTQELRKSKYKITFSIGISDNTEVNNINEALNLSDKRSYESKQSGKGKIIT